jgi:hypothetical protein
MSAVKQDDIGLTALAESGEATDLSKFTVMRLQSLLKERGLPVSGKKAELIARLRLDASEAPQGTMRPDDGHFSEAEVMQLLGEVEAPKPILDEDGKWRGRTSDDKEDFSQLTVPELKALLEKRGLPMSGTKEELIMQLEIDQELELDLCSSMAEVSSCSSNRGGHRD